MWKDILYGSDKEYFWYASPTLRACLDFNQGGAMVDLRPYAAQVSWETGIGTDHVYDASYPYLIQINYRAGYFTHYAGAGTIKSCKVHYHGRSADLCLCRTMATFQRCEKGVMLTADPVTVTLDGLDITVESEFFFCEETGEVHTTRRILNDLHGEEVTFEEYLTGGFGTTEYQADMTRLTLGVDGESFAYGYLGKKLERPGQEAWVNIPDVSTRVSMGGDADTAEVEEGIAFSPVYHIRLKKTISEGEVRTWLRLQKGN